MGANDEAFADEVSEVQLRMRQMEDRLWKVVEIPTLSSFAAEGLIQTNQKTARNILRTMSTLAVLHLLQEGGGYPSSIADMEASTDTDLALRDDGTSGGYKFFYTRKKGKRGFEAHAHPVNPGLSGKEYYFVDESNEYRYSTEGPAGPQSPKYTSE